MYIPPAATIRTYQQQKRATLLSVRLNINRKFNKVGNLPTKYHINTQFICGKKDPARYFLAYKKRSNGRPV